LKFAIWQPEKSNAKVCNLVGQVSNIAVIYSEEKQLRKQSYRGRKTVPNIIYAYFLNILPVIHRVEEGIKNCFGGINSGPMIVVTSCVVQHTDRSNQQYYQDSVHQNYVTLSVLHCQHAALPHLCPTSI